MDPDAGVSEKQTQSLHAGPSISHPQPRAHIGSRSSGSMSGDEKHVLESDPKARAIFEACKWRMVDELKELALSKGGFLSDSLRQQAWPVLLGLALDGGVPDSDSPPETLQRPWRELPRHRDEDQVRLDVDRAFIYYPNLENPTELERRKADLSDLIVEVLRRHPYLCYFQGYHDICQVFLLVLEPEQRAQAVARLSLLRIRDFMLPNLAPAVAQLRLLPDILRAADPALWRHLSETEPFFALSGTLTMYAHDVQTLGEISRLFDALLARDPVFSIYVFAAIVLSRREELFDTPATEPEMLHSILSKIPQPLDLDALLARAVSLAAQHPPERLPAWNGVSAASALRTARGTMQCAQQTVSYGKACFDRQVRELEWVETRAKLKATLWKYRRPARVFGFAVAFGVLAFWLRRSPGLLANIAAAFTRWTG